MCTMIPVIVAPDSKTSESWKKFVANILPGRRSQYAKDPDFSGAFYVENFEELNDERLHEHIQKYLCLVKNRATCRITEQAWEAPTSIDRFIDDYGDNEVEATEGSITTGGMVTQ